MKQIALSIDAMKHLESLGLDTSDASMYWALVDGGFGTLCNDLRTNKPYNDLEKNEGTSYNEYYAYTLQDIVQKITSWSNHLVISFAYFDEGVSCILSTENDNVLHDCSASVYKKETDIDAAYKMLLWCIENGYIKTNKV